MGSDLTSSQPAVQEDWGQPRVKPASIGSFVVSRAALIAATLLVLLCLAFSVHRFGSALPGWRLMGVSALQPAFADLHGVTNPIDCKLAGQDPAATTNCDPLHRRYNYPPIWLDLRYVGITSRSTVAFGLVLAGLTLAAQCLLFRTSGRLETFFAFMGLASPPSLMLIERGNIDQVIYFLLVYGCAVTAAFGLHRKLWFRSALIVVMTILKVYPAGVAIALIRGRHRFLWAIGAFVASIAALFLTAGKALFDIQKNTPQDALLSFGSYSIAQFLFHIPASAQLTAAQSRAHLLASIAACAVAAVTLTLGALKAGDIARLVPLADSDSRRGAVALGGVAIYGFVFILGSNFIYRLVFLLPLLAFFVAPTIGNKPRLTKIACLLLIAFLWSTRRPTPFLPERLLDLTVFMLSTIWLGASLLGREHPDEDVEVQTVPAM